MYVWCGVATVACACGDMYTFDDMPVVITVDYECDGAVGIAGNGRVAGVAYTCCHDGDVAVVGVDVGLLC